MPCTGALAGRAAVRPAVGGSARHAPPRSECCWISPTSTPQLNPAVHWLADARTKHAHCCNPFVDAAVGLYSPYWQHASLMPVPHIWPSPAHTYVLLGVTRNVTAVTAFSEASVLAGPGSSSGKGSGYGSILATANSHATSSSPLAAGSKTSSAAPSPVPRSW